MKRAILMLAMLPLLLNAFSQNNEKPNVRNDKVIEKCFSENMLEVKINAAGRLWIKTNTKSDFGGDIKNIRANAKDIIKSAPQKHILAIVTDEEHSTPQKAINKVKEEMKEAYRELRDELAQKKYGKAFKSLKDEEKEVIRKNYPYRIISLTKDIDFDEYPLKLPEPDTIFYTDTVVITIKDR